MSSKKTKVVRTLPDRSRPLYQLFDEVKKALPNDKTLTVTPSEDTIKDTAPWSRVDISIFHGAETIRVVVKWDDRRWMYEVQNDENYRVVRSRFVEGGVERILKAFDLAKEGQVRYAEQRKKRNEEHEIALRELQNLKEQVGVGTVLENLGTSYHASNEGIVVEVTPCCDRKYRLVIKAVTDTLVTQVSLIKKALGKE